MRFQFNRLTPTGLIRLVAEAVLLFLVAWAPWPFASVEYAWESVLIGGTALLVLLWFTHGYFQGQLTIRPDEFSVVLLILAFLSLFQLIPLPQSVVGTLSPTRLQLHQQMLPQSLEQLTGEAASTRDSMIPLTFDPFATRVFLAQVLSLLLLYTVVRSWLSSREYLRRLAWVAAVNGFLLAFIGIAQFFSSPNHVVFWSVETSGAVFGPFICKNHFPDYVLFCLGLGVGLLMSRQGPKAVKIKGIEYKLNRLGKLTDSPDLVIMGSALILMMMSIPFTLSRGGLLATGVAAAATAALVYRTRGSLSRGLAIGGVLVLAAILLGGWYGWGVVSERLQTLGTGKAADQRQELWSDVSTLIPTFLGTGGGNGAFPRFEAITRTEPHPEFMVMENAHNEYLEALLEGGVIRLVLTLALCYLALRSTVQAYLRLQDRSSGPLVLGIFFGLVGLIVHSFVDFGIHMPAIAFLATVMVAFAADAATDPTYIPFRKKTVDGPPPDAGRKVLRGPAFYAFAIGVSAVAVWLLIDSKHRGRAEEYKVAARNAARDGTLKQHTIRIEALSEAVRLTPSDGTAWMLLAQARFEAAEEEIRVLTMALNGAPSTLGLPADAFLTVKGDHVREGLIAARTARSRSPLLPRPHLFLARYGDGFAQHEPAHVHLERAQRAAPTDATIFVLRGNDALKTGNRAAALEFWQKAMVLNSTKVTEILVTAQKTMTAEQILAQVLPPEPLVIFSAADQLYPRWKPDTAEPRKPYLERVIALDGKKDWNARSWAAIAKAQAELGHGDRAFAAWNQTIAKDPEAYDLHDAFSRWLEEDERYESAVQQLEWLRDHRDSRDVQDRLDAVRHALALKKIIEGK